MQRTAHFIIIIIIIIISPLEHKKVGLYVQQFNRRTIGIIEICM